jgi:hypothetical protein
LRIINLKGRKPKIEQETVYVGQSQVVQNARQMPKIFLRQPYVRPLAKPAPRNCQGRPISIETDQNAAVADSLKDALRMAAAAHRGIHYYFSRSARQ